MCVFRKRKDTKFCVSDMRNRMCTHKRYKSIYYLNSSWYIQPIRTGRQCTRSQKEKKRHKVCVSDVRNRTCTHKRCTKSIIHIPKLVLVNPTLRTGRKCTRSQNDGAAAWEDTTIPPKWPPPLLPPPSRPRRTRRHRSLVVWGQ